ncbi:MAG: Uracil phosphoribosyltransferase [Chloroflexi bacterium ADurb.Bin180]|nr:MAG: Uracil phosphoribosyltransferase [Chloroflexi bacterium ADurb.Bin180]HNR96543.1 uracil phosphoribosyltransferase [Anaerolineae bacterium]HOU23783.1 uracil phosphoribosyltransferase [Anaerolineae bacterium]HQJ50742.1 uracil phosphoribosyltransferase [Anaerolineae bacterium]
MSRLVVSNHPLIRHKVTLLRSKDTEPKKFRELIREVAMLLAYEATADLGLEECLVQTPLASTIGYELTDKIGLVPILRAGLGMVEGIWELMPAAEVWHIGLYRDHKSLQPVQYYNKLPVHPTVQVCLILDPMLATGGSAVAAVDVLKKWGAKRIKYVGIIGAPEGVERLRTAHPDVDIHLAVLDDHLTPAPVNEKDPPQGYIVPGLGDAGDRQFGTG